MIYNIIPDINNSTNYNNLSTIDKKYIDRNLDLIQKILAIIINKYISIKLDKKLNYISDIVDIIYDELNSEQKSICKYDPKEVINDYNKKLNKTIEEKNKIEIENKESIKNQIDSITAHINAEIILKAAGAPGTPAYIKAENDVKTARDTLDKVNKTKQESDKKLNTILNEYNNILEKKKEADNGCLETSLMFTKNAIEKLIIKLETLLNMADLYKKRIYYISGGNHIYNMINIIYNKRTEYTNRDIKLINILYKLDKINISELNRYIDDIIYLI